MDRKHLGIVAGCTIGNAVSMTPAVHAVFGIFLIPLAAAFGWPRAAISGVFAIFAVTGAIVLPLAGRHADRHGARRIVLAGNLALAAAIAALSLADGNILHFYLSFLLVAIAGSIPSTALLSKLVSDWFDARRGTMLGISAGLGNAIGSTVMPIAAAIMMPLLGWRGTYVGIGAIVAGIGFPALFLLLRDPPRYGGEAGGDAPPADGLTLGEAARTPVFWLLATAIACAAGCLTAVFSHVVPILAERRIPIAAATGVISVFALVTAGCQIATGTLLDRVPSARVTAPMVLAGVGGLALLVLGTGPLALGLAGALLGIGLGTQFGALPYLIARYFGLRSFGTIIGTMYSAVCVVQGATPILLDRCFDVQGSYRGAMLGLGIALTLGAALLLLLPPYRRPAAAMLAPVHV